MITASLTKEIFLSKKNPRKQKGKAMVLMGHPQVEIFHHSMIAWTQYQQLLQESCSLF